MIRAVDDMGASMTGDLAAANICDGKVPSDCEQIGGCIGQEQLPWSQGHRAGHENPGQGIVDGLMRQLVSNDDS